MASSNRTRRIAKEIAEIKNDQHSHIIVEPAGNGDDLTHLRGQFKGPPDTPYEGGTFVIDIKIPSEYPFRPPVMRFVTKIYHPNVSSQTVCDLVDCQRIGMLTHQGAICLDTLKDAWSPVLTIKSALISLQSLLSTPEPSDPQDAVVASLLISKPEEFAIEAQNWAVKYAGAPPRDDAQSSGGATEETLKQKKKEAKETEKQVKLAAYVWHRECATCL